MAGHSRRFQASGYPGPKAMLLCGRKRMIEHAIDMFDTNKDHYHIVLNEIQNLENPELVPWLKSLAANVSTIIIPVHELGPVYSALQIDGIPDGSEILLSYCDFYVDWNYQQFLRQVQGTDGAIVSFRGFQPASFGTTLYAYMKVEANSLIELREKRSFTSNRSLEHASVGIYYYRNWSLFKKYANQLMYNNQFKSSEAYASLIYNDMISDDLNITIYEARRFICLGTPEDYEQYQFWSSYFSKRQEISIDNRVGVKRVALMPMAGRGSRFERFGYRVIKPLIKVCGEPMIMKAAQSIPYVDEWIFLPRAEDLIRHPITNTLKKLVGKLTVMGVDHQTSGQAATCMLAAEFIDDDAELIIASCDYEMRYFNKAWISILNDKSIDGVIWTYRTRGMPVKNPDAFAYCETAEDGRTVKRVVEKKTISHTPHLDPLVVGTFWFRRAANFKKAAYNLINNDIRINGEHYVGTSINHLIENNFRFIIFDIEQWISFGDPFELQIMEFWQDHFENKNSFQ